MTHRKAAGALEELRSEITARGRYEQTTLVAIEEVMGPFRRFCQEHGVPSLPAGQDTVLAYLHGKAPLAHATAKTVVSRIKGAHELEGHQTPDWPLTHDYLKALRKDPDSPALQPKVATLDEAEAEAMLTRLAAGFTTVGRTDDVVALRAAVVTARFSLAPAETWGQVLHQLCESSRNEDPGASSGFRRLDVTAAAVLAAAAGLRRPGAGLDNIQVRERMRCVARRCGLTSWRPAAMRALSERDYEAVLAYCDTDYERNARDLTYLTMGLDWALRHISAAHLDITDVHPTARGYRAVFRCVKKAAGEVVRVDFDHSSEDASTCVDVFCPACAVHRQLDVCRRRGRAAGPLLATFYGGQWRPMTRQNGRLRVLDAYQAATAEQPTRRVATRTLRRTGATWAVVSGMPMAEVAATVSHHQDETTFAGYLDLDSPEFEAHPVYA